MAIDDRFIDELKERIVLSDLVGRRTRLKKQGRGWVGLSPFTSEKTPSFFVYDDRGFYRCFSSGTSGDAITFLRETENLSFVEAVEKLAAMAGLDLPRDTDVRSRDAHADLHDILTQAADWFSDTLHGREGQAARAYIDQRGISTKTCKRYGLGYAPSGWRALIGALGKDRLDLLCAAGLAVRPESGSEPYDRFRNRLIFPIHDARQRVIAFGGRTLDPSDPVKYINSPETALFRKSRTLFRYAQARAACASGQTMPVLVEGYMDAIALADAGIDSATAPLGTALSADQLSLLWRAGPEPVICFDGDAAGQRAALAVASMAMSHLRPGYSLFFASMPVGSDPDDLVRQNGAEAMRARLRSARPLVEVIWQSLHDRHRPDTPERRAGLQKALDQVASAIGDPMVRSAYHREFRNRLFALDRGRYGRSVVRSAPTVGGLHKCSGLALLARVIDTPGLAAEMVEQLALAEFDNRHTAALRDTVLSLHESGKATDRASVIVSLGEQGLSRAATLLAATSERPLEDADQIREWKEAIGEFCFATGLDKEAERTRRDFVRATAPDEQKHHWQRRSELMLQKRRSRVRANDPAGQV